MAGALSKGKRRAAAASDPETVRQKAPRRQADGALITRIQTGQGRQRRTSDGIRARGYGGSLQMVPLDNRSADWLEGEGNGAGEAGAALNSPVARLAS